MTAPLLSYVALYTLRKDETAGSVGLRVHMDACFAARTVSKDSINRRTPPDRVGMLCFPDLDRLRSGIGGGLSPSDDKSSEDDGDAQSQGASSATDKCSTHILDTEEQGRLYCFTRRVTGLSFLKGVGGFPATICIVTANPWFTFWRTVMAWVCVRLRALSCGESEKEFGTSEAWVAVVELVQAIAYNTVPKCGESLRIYSDYSYRAKITESVRRPNDELKPVGENLTHLLLALPPTKVVLTVASLLSGKSVVVVGEDLPALTQSVTALAMLLYPFTWPHTFASVLPCDECKSLWSQKKPFLVGMLAYKFDLFRTKAAAEKDSVIVVDLRDGNVSASLSAMSLLPQTFLFQLRETLNVAVSSLPSSAGLDNEMVYSAFRTFLAKAVGHYELFFACELFEFAPVTFNTNAFIESHSIPEQRFLKVFCNTLLFQTFIDKKIAEITTNQRRLKQTQFDLDILREVPKDSPQYIDALRSPITNQLPVQMQRATEFLAAGSPERKTGDDKKEESSASPKKTEQRSDDKEQSHNVGMELFPEGKPFGRSFFEIHSMFAPESGVPLGDSEPTTPRIDGLEMKQSGGHFDLSLDGDIYADMPDLGPVIVQTPPPPERKQEQTKEEEPKSASLPEEKPPEKKPVQQLLLFDDLLDFAPTTPLKQPQPLQPTKTETAIDLLTEVFDTTPLQPQPKQPPQPPQPQQRTGDEMDDPFAGENPFEADAAANGDNNADPFSSEFDPFAAELSSSSSQGQQQQQMDENPFEDPFAFP